MLYKRIASGLLAALCILTIVLAYPTTGKNPEATAMAQPGSGGQIWLDRNASRQIMYRTWSCCNVYALWPGQMRDDVMRFRGTDGTVLTWMFYGECWDGIKHKSQAGYSTSTALWTVVPRGCDVRVLSVDRVFAKDRHK